MTRLWVHHPHEPLQLVHVRVDVPLQLDRPVPGRPRARSIGRRRAGLLSIVDSDVDSLHPLSHALTRAVHRLGQTRENVCTASPSGTPRPLSAATAPPTRSRTSMAWMRRASCSSRTCPSVDMHLGIKAAIAAAKSSYCASVRLAGGCFSAAAALRDATACQCWSCRRVLAHARDRVDRNHLGSYLDVRHEDPKGLGGAAGSPSYATQCQRDVGPRIVSHSAWPSSWGGRRRNARVRSAR